MNKLTLLSFVIAGALIFFAFTFSKSNPLPNDVPENNVSIVDGVQVVEILAKGGYFPEKSVAKAGIPTILRLKTSGTFDCSSIVRIPSLNITKNLPPSGGLDVDLGSPKAGVMQGTCGMGMYPYEIDFQE
ncbi:MAG: cupredoxin domain-containing protein [Candidatus Campbellbacteria bacterium]|nr:cupredoxin domain-containing protein [Candidatus Campbellbacteria bacterium]